jgi:tRNA threonylcarbamoyladenosine biosynthesis protein TsaE
MTQTESISHSAEETIELGRELARRLRPPVLVLLSGELGSGKTTLSKGIISGLGAAREEDVTSPTFTLVHVFQNHSTGAGPPSVLVDSPPQIKVYHVDLYRIEQSADIESLGLEDALSEPAVVLIEWPERFSLRTDWPRITVSLEHLEGDSRRITVSSSLPEALPGQ